MPMDNNSNVIFEYTDRQAVEDGVLVSVNGPGKVNRVTRAAFDHLTEQIDQQPPVKPVIDTTALMKVINDLVRTDPDESGWRTGNHSGRMLWLVPNEVSGFTLMFPSDY